MPIYGDDQCANCGGVRVAESTLCADCLAGYHEGAEKELLIKGMVIETKKKRIACLQGLLKEAMAYGFKQNQENVKMLNYIKELEGKTEEEEKDGKDRDTEDTEKGEKWYPCEMR